MFVPTIYIENSNNNMSFEVSDKKLHHLNHVLRLRDGDQVNISDGKGQISYGNFINNNVEIKNSRMYQRQNSLKIFVPYLREKSRFRFLIEKYTDIKHLMEKYCEVNLLFPKQYLGSIMQLLSEKRGIQEDLNYLSTSMVKVRYKLPLLELVSGFYDTLKSISQGFASLDYEILDFEKGNLVKLDILVNGQIIDSFSSILSKENAEFVGRNRVKKLSELIPRQQFDIPIQAAVGSRIIARETIKALRKDVTAKLYGGDVTRKRKLLEKQKEGKKKMRQIGKVNVPKEAFRDFLKQ